MSIAVCSCQCGSSDSLARGTLKAAGYKDWLTIPIEKGKDKSRRLLERLPQHPEIQMLDNYLQNASKWVVIIGWDNNTCKWSDVAHNGAKSSIEAEFIVKTFGETL